MSKLYNKIAPYLLVSLVVILSTVTLWFPFITRQTSWFGLLIPESNFQYIYRNFDGPLYIIPAKTLYNPQAIDKIGLEIPLPPNYFAAHLPLYPFLIRFGAPPLGYLKSMIFISVLFSILLGMFFYKVARRLNLTRHPITLTALFLFLPRFLVVRSIGAPETLFLFLVLHSLYFFERRNYLWAGVFGGLATMTKTPGVLLAAAYFLVFAERYVKTKKIPWAGLPALLLVPLGLLGVFLIYLRQYGDFFAYFKSGDNIHLVAPFSVFNFQKIWVGTAWLDDVVFYFFLYGLTVLTLFRSKYRSFFYFSLTFFISVLFVQHRDIARYSLPLWPLAVIAFEKFFTSRKFLTIFIILLPGFFMYAWNFLVHNILPISNWAPYL